mmetsp:Transcript_17587/g.26066  ORF Transcript_17587/g.26066 Transcript_17587/m.26066 type:complete len:272 (-) Transcript_17587:65-880(-)
MGRFVLIDFKKRAEQKRLRLLVSDTEKKLDMFIKAYPNDGTPPTEDECTKLTDDQVTTLLEAFDTEAGKSKLPRIQDEVPKKRATLVKRLSYRKGKLYSRFSKAVEALTDQAASIMNYCVSAMKENDDELEGLIPVAEKRIEEEFAELLTDVTAHINDNYPEGVTGLDSYDEGLPEGIPTFAEYKEMLKTKEEEWKAKNKEAIPAGIDRLKVNYQAMVKKTLNAAIEEAMVEIEKDLSDDTVPYLEEGAMVQLRAELIASAKEYCTSRLDV